MVNFKRASTEIGNRFLELLKKYQINPPCGSYIEDELLSLTRLIEITKNPNLVCDEESKSVLSFAAGLHDLAAKILSVESLPEFKEFLPHLRLIAATKIPKASLRQNGKSDIRDDTSRKITELYLACLAAHIGTDVLLDHPTNSKGDNPDIIFTAEIDGFSAQRWTFAIKSISSKQGQTIYERIKEAGNQINHANCEAEYGMVIINTKDALDHDALWNPSVSFKSLEEAKSALLNQLKQFAEDAIYNRPKADWDEIFVEKVVRPVIFMGQSLVKLTTDFSDQTPTQLKMLLIFEADGEVDPIGFNIATYMNEFMQHILLGIPGKKGHLPR